MHSIQNTKHRWNLDGKAVCIFMCFGIKSWKVLFSHNFIVSSEKKFITIKTNYHTDLHESILNDDNFQPDVDAAVILSLILDTGS